MVEQVAFGLFLPQIGLTFRQIVDAAVAAAHLQFRHIWFIDHFEVLATGLLEGWTIATAVAAHVPGIRIGHLVLCAGVRHPALLGRMAATLDTVSDGRLDLGLGWGGAPEELRSYGVSRDSAATRREKLGETIDILRAMLSDAPVVFAGRHYSVNTSCPGPPTVQRRVPIFIGGAGVATMQLVRERADWWNCPSYALTELPRLVPLARPARISANYSLAIDDRVTASPLLSGPAGAPCLLGRSEGLADVLRSHRAHGVELFNIQFVRIDALAEQMERFMAEVAPSVRGEAMRATGD